MVGGCNHRRNCVRVRRLSIRQSPKSSTTFGSILANQKAWFRRPTQKFLLSEILHLEILTERYWASGYPVRRDFGPESRLPLSKMFCSPVNFGTSIKLKVMDNVQNSPPFGDSKRKRVFQDWLWSYLYKLLKISLSPAHSRSVPSSRRESRRESRSVVLIMPAHSRSVPSVVESRRLVPSFVPFRRVSCSQSFRSVASWLLHFSRWILLYLIYYPYYRHFW